MKKDEQDNRSIQNVPVRLKGVGDSLCVTLDPALPVDDLQKELSVLFKRCATLAVNAKVVLDTGEKEGYEELIEVLGAFLKSTFGVGSVSAMLKKKRSPDPDEKRSPDPDEDIRKRDVEGSWHHYRSEVLMLMGRVRSGQKVTAENHLLILGDVNPGAEVWAGGDILIMGSLRGTAVAGQPENEKAIVLALDFQPTQIQIGGIVGAGLPPSSKKQVEFAHVENDTIVVEAYLEANTFGRLPWLQVR
ncbi:MAG: hypothetical protein BWK80_21975 [Desulfobacteraceae bacterium IS3]|nr:MAG: hypothetical protein BWK80_21975 [Desulfobacteraceae bacterium IS3]